MQVRAGDIRDFSVDGRQFDPMGGSNWNMRLGGFDNETAISGNGQLHVTQRRMTAGLGDAAISMDMERGDYEFLQERKDSAKLCPVNVTLASGHTYSGECVLTGETQFNSGEGQATLELRGAKFERI